MVNFDEMKSSKFKVSEDELCDRVGTNITSSDLVRYFGDEAKDHILRYSELAKYKNLLELLPKNKAYKIILIEEERNLGHWVLITRQGNTIEFFNSYGQQPEAGKKLLGQYKNRMMGQDNDEIKRLFATQPRMKFVYNDFPFQKLKDGVNTCGRWVILRIITMKDLEMDLKEFTELVKNKAKNMGIPKDGLVSLWIG